MFRIRLGSVPSMLHLPTKKLSKFNILKKRNIFSKIKVGQCPLIRSKIVAAFFIVSLHFCMITYLTWYIYFLKFHRKA